MSYVIIGPSNDDGDKFKVPTSHSSHIFISFQNRSLYAALSDPEGFKDPQKVVCMVPGLISVLSQDSEGIRSQDLRFGSRVGVIALPAHPLWKAERRLRFGRPEGLGLDMSAIGVDDEFLQCSSAIRDFETV